MDIQEFTGTTLIFADPTIIAAVISAGAALIGRIFGRIGRKKATQEAADIQLDQQTQLTGVQEEAQGRLMDRAQENQKEMFDYTAEYNTPANQRARLEDAGLNAGLMYSGGAGMGGGSTTAGSGSALGVTGGIASDIASLMQADNQRKMVNMQYSKNVAEIANIVANTKKTETETKNIQAETRTTEETREILKKNMQLQGVGQWIDNEINKIYLQGDANEMNLIRDEILNDFIGINANSWTRQSIISALTKTQEEINNIKVDSVLKDDQSKNIYAQLLIAQQNADAKMIEAKAKELAIRWGTGEFTNWKTWVEVGEDAIKTLSSLIPGIGKLIKK